MEVKFLDLKCQKELELELVETATSVIRGTNYILGNFVEQFETQFAQYCGVKYAVGVGNGLDALVLILKALNIGNGDEVIVPSNTFIATWLAVSYVGATPIPVEPNGLTYNIEASEIEKYISKKTKAIIPVHLYGQICEMDKIIDLGAKHNIHIIEDAAQAHGAALNNKKAGSFGIAAGFSFYPGKNLGALGDSGGITTSSDEILRKVLALRNYGSVKKYYHDEMGLNSRLDELQAAFLLKKIAYLEAWTTRRRQIANLYSNELKNIEQLIIPSCKHNENHVWHLYVIRTKRREALQKHLQENQISCLIHYPVPPHLSGAYKNFSFRPLKATEEMSQEILSLPIGPHLSDEQVLYTISKIKSFFQ